MAILDEPVVVVEQHNRPLRFPSVYEFFSSDGRRLGHARARLPHPVWLPFYLFFIRGLGKITVDLFHEDGTRLGSFVRPSITSRGKQFTSFDVLDGAGNPVGMLRKVRPQQTMPQYELLDRQGQRVASMLFLQKGVLAPQEKREVIRYLAADGQLLASMQWSLAKWRGVWFAVERLECSYASNALSISEKLLMLAGVMTLDSYFWAGF